MDEYPEGSFGYEVERVRSEGLALADEVSNPIGRAYLRRYFNRRADEALRNMAEARDATLREFGLIP